MHDLRKNAVLYCQIAYNALVLASDEDALISRASVIVGVLAKGCTASIMLKRTEGPTVRLTRLPKPRRNAELAAIVGGMTEWLAEAMDSITKKNIRSPLGLQRLRNLCLKHCCNVDNSKMASGRPATNRLMKYRFSNK